MRLLILLPLLFSTLWARAQQLPHFDVLLFHYTTTPTGINLGTPRFLTAFNPDGYNNQPCFFPNRELYLTVQMPDDTTQTEIYSLNPDLRQRTRVTATPTAEYSPTPMPDGRRFSTIRVEEDGSQRLWSFPLDRSDNGRLVFANQRSVGYHCWLRDTLCALFIVGENGAPHTLVLADTRQQRSLRIASNIGRCMLRLPDGRLAFVQKATEQTWFIKAYDPDQKTTDILLKTLPGVEDFAVLPDGSFLAGKDAKLWRSRPGSAGPTDWTEVADLSSYGVRSITRLAAGESGRLAVVVQ